MANNTSSYDHWLVAQAQKTTRPKLYFNAWKCVLSYRGSDLDYIGMAETIRAAYGKKEDIPHTRLPPAKYIAIPHKYMALYHSLTSSGKIEFGAQQEEALKRIRRWLSDPNAPQKFILFGFAGTGKTTLAKEISTWQRTVAVAFTGMSAMQLSMRGLNAMTVHSFIYAPQRDEDTGQMSYSLRIPSPMPDLIILDEAGMLGKAEDDDLTSLGIRMLVMGDPFQLPSVDQSSPYDDADHDYQLTEIHRQALDNPIIWLSREIREGRRLKVGKYGDSRVVTQAGANKRLDSLILAHQGESKIIVGRNSTRNAYNDRARQLLGFKGVIPNEGETLMCLKNERMRGLINGQLWTVLRVSAPYTHTCRYTQVNKRTGEVESKLSTWGPNDYEGKRGEPVTVEAIKLSLVSQFEKVTVHDVVVPLAFWHGNANTLHWKQLAATSAFDFGYTLTAHKAQGSTFFNTFVYDESHYFEQPRRWQYSASTRPSNDLTFATIP